MPLAPQLEDLLEAQAAAWQAHQPEAAPPPALPAQDQAVLQLAHRLHTALRPVAPRPEFVARLKTQLQATPKTAVPAPSLVTRPWLWFAAGLGGAIVGLAALLGWRTWKAQGR